MGFQRSRSRASNEPYVDPTDGHVVQHRVMSSDIELVSEFVRRRYHSADYLAALLGRNKSATSHRLRDLKVKGVDVLKLCDRQIENVAERTIGTLYYELGSEGYAMLSEEGIVLPERGEDKIFAHTLMVDQIMASIEIGVRQQPDLTIEYRDDLP